MRLIVGMALLATAAPLLAHGAFTQASGASSAAETVKEKPTPADGYFEELQPVAPGVWLIGQRGFHVQPIGNVTLVEQSDGLVVIDAGGSPGSGRRIVNLIRAASAKPVKAIAITHWHGDHVMGLSELLKAWPNARTISTSPTRGHLANPKTMNSPGTPDAARNAKFLEQVRGFQSYIKSELEKAPKGPVRDGWATGLRLMNQYEIDMDGALTVAPKEGFADRLLLDDRERPVELLFLGRGNTDGDLVAWLPKQRIAASGDLVVSPSPYGFNSYPTDWPATLGKLKGLGYTTLIPGHGPVQRDMSYVDDLLSLLDATREQAEPFAKQGMKPADIVKGLNLAEHRQRFVGGDLWKRQWFDSYWTQPIVSAIAREAKGEQIVQSLGN